MDTTQHNPARLCNSEPIGSAVVQHKQTEMLGLKGKRQKASV
jgi:hypothetical protein